LENLKWLLSVYSSGRNFGYINFSVFREAIYCGNTQVLDWLLENKFPYSNDIFTIAFSNLEFKIMKWILANNLKVKYEVSISYDYFSNLYVRTKRYKIKSEILMWLSQ